MTLKITGTPEFFVNGKRAEVSSFDELKTFIERTMREAYPQQC